jgi:hypothetical protein
MQATHRTPLAIDTKLASRQWGVRPTARPIEHFHRHRGVARNRTGIGRRWRGELATAGGSFGAKISSFPERVAIGGLTGLGCDGAVIGLSDEEGAVAFGRGEGLVPHRGLGWRQRGEDLLREIPASPSRWVRPDRRLGQLGEEAPATVDRLLSVSGARRRAPPKINQTSLSDIIARPGAKR